MVSLWTRGGLRWRELARRIWRQIFQDELIGRAAELAYFFLFSVFPLLLFLTTLLGYLTHESDLLRGRLFGYVSRVSPSADVTKLLRNTLRQVSERWGTGKLSLGLFAAIWVASNGILAVGRTLNAAYGLRESRPWWKRRLVGLALTVACALLTIAGLTLGLYGSELRRWLADFVAAPDLVSGPWAVLRWILAMSFLLVTVELVYNFAPDLPRRRRAWLTPGAVLAVLLWTGASWGFRSYVAHFGRYSSIYGSLGAVILLLLWFYLAGWAILVGGEVNSEIGNALEAGEERRRGSGG